MNIIETAPAKINLYLDVTGRRADGYHNIKSIMQTVDLCDTVTVEAEDTSADTAEIIVTCTGPDVPCGEKNLAYKAAKAFFDALSVTPQCRIHIDKVIPMAAGLAGGSSDAAAVLRALNNLYKFPLDMDALCRLGGGLGADVPFCIRGGTMIAEGIGEVLRMCTPMPESHIVVAIGGEGVSTPEAYRRIDERFGGDFDRPDDRFTRLICALSARDVSGIAENMVNIFEEVVLPVRPTARKIRECMLASGAIGAMMSGSGPSVFGIFESESAAKGAAEALDGVADRAFCCASQSVIESEF